MRERPILFSTPMVRAILAGAKTQTRRVVKPVGDDDGFVLQDYGAGWWPYRSDDGESPMKGDNEIPHPCPYGQPGDRLWVRETWQHHDWTKDGEPIIGYAAGGTWLPCVAPDLTDRWAELSHPENFAIKGRACDQRWRPSIHMPRWASRITLEVTGVRVERLQDISTGDCWAEGIESSPDANPLHEYCDLWESINGPGSWDANPWVWVVEFHRANEKTHRSAALGADHDGRVGAVGHSGAAA